MQEREGYAKQVLTAYFAITATSTEVSTRPHCTETEVAVSSVCAFLPYFIIGRQPAGKSSSSATFRAWRKPRHCPRHDIGYRTQRQYSTRCGITIFHLQTKTIVGMQRELTGSFVRCKRYVHRGIVWLTQKHLESNEIPSRYICNSRLCTFGWW